MLKGNTSTPPKTHPELFSILLSSRNKNRHLHVKKHEKSPDLYMLPTKHQNGLTKTKQKQSKLQKQVMPWDQKVTPTALRWQK